MSAPVVETARSAGKVAPPAATVHRGTGAPRDQRASGAAIPTTSQQQREREARTSRTGDGPRRRKSCFSHCWNFDWPCGLMVVHPAFGYPRTAAMIKPITSTAAAQRFSASQIVVYPSALRAQETTEPMMPGKAAAALPTCLAKTRPKACKCFLTHSFTPPLSDGFGAGTWVGTLPPPPVSARTIVLTVIPSAVRIDMVVIPCSRKRVRSRCRIVVSS